MWKPDYPKAILGNGILYAGTKAIVYGKYKSMKSMLVQRLCLSITSGVPWLGFQTPSEGVSVLYLQLEIPHPILQDRILTMTNGIDTTKKEMLVWTEHYLKLDLPQGFERVKGYLEKYQPDVLIIDPIYKVISADLTRPHAVQIFIDNIDRLLSDYPITVLLVSHSVKPQQSKDDKLPPDVWGSDDMLGTTLFSAWADSVIKVERKDPELRVKFEVIRHAKVEIRPVVVCIDEQLTFPIKTVSI